MNKNRMQGRQCSASWQMATKPTFIKGTECKSSGCALKAVSSLRKSLPVLLIPFPQFCRNILATSRFNKAAHDRDGCGAYANSMQRTKFYSEQPARPRHPCYDIGAI